MKRSRTRVWAGVATLVASSVLPLLGAPTAGAAGVLQGEASLRTANGAAPLTSGNSDTDFTLRLPTGASCTGDSANDGYRVQSYLVPASVDPSTLTFNASGPVPVGVGANLRQPLFTTTGDSYVNAQTANAPTPPGPGPIINIPNFDFAVLSPGDIPAGAYNLGIACTLGAPSATQMREFWNTKVTFATDLVNGGTAGVTFQFGAVASVPVLNTVTPAQQSLTATFTPGASVPAATSFTVTATPITPGAVGGSATGAASPITVPGLTASAQYSVAVTATNAVGTSAASNAITATVADLPAVQNLVQLAAAPGATTINLDWDAPAGPTPTGYSVVIAPSAGTATVTGTSAAISGLTAGSYTCTVTPQHAAPQVASPASIPCSLLSAQVLVQEITATRPVGALVLTQRCGVGATAPFLGPNGTGGFDPNATEYPYPIDEATGLANPNYPTYCGVALGTAKLITSGTGAGQFFEATGALNRVTVVDTRDQDLGWTINGAMGTFTSASDTFSGSQLGWTPVKTSDTAGFTDSSGNAYDQTASAGPAVAPNTLAASGLTSGSALGSAPAGSGLGIAVFDAALRLLIPITAINGNYQGVLSVTVA